MIGDFEHSGPRHLARRVNRTLVGIMVSSFAAGAFSALNAQEQVPRDAAVAMQAPAQAGDTRLLPLPSNWTDRLKVNGDVRIRGEYTEKEDDPSRERMRLRARLWLDAMISDNLKAVIGLATGDGDPASSNQTMDDAFSRKPIRLDLAYIDWRPGFAPGLALDAGKMRNPCLVVDDLIWDADVTPEGLALGYKRGFGPVELIANAMAFWVDERHKVMEKMDGGAAQSTDADTLLYTGQLGFKYKPCDTAHVLVAGSYYHYQNMAGYQALCDGTMSYGNSTVSPGGSADKYYLYEYRIWEGMAELGLTCPLTGLPVRLYGNFVKNADPDSDNAGFMAGIRFNNASEANTFAVDYNYSRLEKDAVVGAFTDRDRWGGGTDGQGHKVRGTYMLAKNLALDVTVFLDESAISGEGKSFRRYQADLTAKF